MDHSATCALVWSEGTAPEAVYPNDVNASIAEHLNEQRDIIAKTASIDEPLQGVGNQRLDWADVILWWGHLRHDDVTDETVDRIENSVRNDGVGFIGLHSGHYARPFKRLIGMSGDLGAVRDEAESEQIVVVDTTHPIAAGVDAFELPSVEMFGEPFEIPEPDDVVFESSFGNGGEFRSGVTFTFGAGRGVYFRPGHEEYRIYHNDSVNTVLQNATRWAANTERRRSRN